MEHINKAKFKHAIYYLGVLLIFQHGANGDRSMSMNEFDCTDMPTRNHPHPHLCTKFVTCDHGRAFERDCGACHYDPVRCPDNVLHYDYDSDACLWADEANCGRKQRGPPRPPPRQSKPAPPSRQKEKPTAKKTPEYDSYEQEEKPSVDNSDYIIDEFQSKEDLLNKEPPTKEELDSIEETKPEEPDYVVDPHPGKPDSMEEPKPEQPDSMEKPNLEEPDSMEEPITDEPDYLVDATEGPSTTTKKPIIENPSTTTKKPTPMIPSTTTKKPTVVKPGIPNEEEDCEECDGDVCEAEDGDCDCEGECEDESQEDMVLPPVEEDVCEADFYDHCEA